jgi:hypothetical protein
LGVQLRAQFAGVYLSTASTLAAITVAATVLVPFSLFLL